MCDAGGKVQPRLVDGAEQHCAGRVAKVTMRVAGRIETRDMLPTPGGWVTRGATVLCNEVATLAGNPLGEQRDESCDGRGTLLIACVFRREAEESRPGIRQQRVGRAGSDRSDLYGELKQ